ncbi:MAG: hypothetical protein Kow0042_00880 [Calditrichia bacterium]
MKTVFIISFGFLMIFFSGCKEFTGYKYDADPLSEQARIQGTIINIFTGKPVEDALIQFGELKTLTDENGQYFLVYPLGPDESRDKPVPITITARNYESYRDSLILYPQTMEYHAQLVYAAPIIEQTAMVPVTSGLFVCEAVVRDYQGITDIDSVKATIWYAKDLEPFPRILQIGMDYIGSPPQSSDRGYFQCLVLSGLSQGWFLVEQYRITAEDRAGNTHEIFKEFRLSRPDTLLFPPVLP